MGLLEYLKKIFGDEEGQKIFDKLNADQENVLLVDSKKDSKYAEKTELNAANKTIKDYKDQLKNRDKQLEDLQGKVKDNEELTKEIQTLKDANKKVTEDYEAKIKQMNFDSKFDKTLLGYKPKNSKALRALLDMEKVSLDGENFIGLEDQIKSLKESDPYLFEQENITDDDKKGGGEVGDFKGGTGNIITNTTNPGDKKMSLGERLAKQKSEAAKAAEAQNKFFS